MKCRQRIEEALKETEDGKLRVEQAKERRARHEASGAFEELCRSVIEGDIRSYEAAEVGVMFEGETRSEEAALIEDKRSRAARSEA